MVAGRVRLFCGPAESSGNISIASEAGPCRGPLPVRSGEAWVYFNAAAAWKKMLALRYRVALDYA